MPAGETTLDHAYQKDVPQLRSWWHYIKKGNIVFGIVVLALGIGSNFVPFPIGLKDLLSGAIIGAGVAAILTEFTFAFERRESDENQRMLGLQNENLIQQIDTLKSSITKQQLYQNSHLFSLGTSLALIQWQKVDDREQLLNLKDHLMKLASVMGVQDVVEKFINLPDMQTPEAMPAFIAIREAVRLRYAPEEVDTFVTGYTLTSWICGVIGDLNESTLETIRKGILALDLQLDVETYVENGLLAYKAGRCPNRNLIGFLSLLGIYIYHLSFGNNVYISSFFEKEHLPIEEEATVQRMQELLQQEAASGRN